MNPTLAKRSCCRRLLAALAGVCMAAVPCAHSEIKIMVEHLDQDQAQRGFPFRKVPTGSTNDLGAAATWSIIDGRKDPNSSELASVHDGKLPRDEDQPRANFFFAAGTDGGRIRVDLKDVNELKQVNSFSWHPDARAPQVYTLFAADGKSPEFDPEPGRPKDPAKCGWTLLARVDTRPKPGGFGGQYGVSISGSEGGLGSCRYLLFDISRTENEDPFGNTFYSEIDILDQVAAVSAAAPSPQHECREQIETAGYQITLDASDAPELWDWVQKEVGPMARERYPKLGTMLASAEFEAPRRVSISFRQDMGGVAATSGTRVRCAARWFQDNLEGEALGAVFHELVHVVQQYNRAPLAAGAVRAPGWLVEGIADYVRWFKFEPQSRGAEITRRNLSRARYDGNYRISANFLNWVTETYDPDLVPRLNAAVRQGRYSEGLWHDRTGHTVQELGALWRTAMEAKVAKDEPPPP